MAKENEALNEQDQKLADELDQLWIEKNPINVLFDRALESGASIHLIEEITQHYYKPDGTDTKEEPEKLALPWVKKMLTKGTALEVIIDLILKNCFESDHSLVHQAAFLVDQTAWEVFSGSPRRLEDLLVRMAEEHTADYVAEQLHIIRQTIGDKGWHKIGRVVVNNILSVRTDAALQNIAKLPKNLQETAALRLLPNYRTLPFIVRTLKSSAHNSTSGTYYDYRRKLINNKFPLTIPTTLRWAMLGGEPYNDPGGHFRWEDDFSGHPVFRGETTWWQDLRLAAQQNGWQFVKLVSQEVGGQSELVAETSNDSGRKVMYVHNNDGPRGDRLKEGDEVVVLADPTQPASVGHIYDKSRIVYTKSDGKIVVRYELHPLRRPTEEMLRDPETYFFGRDMPLERRKK